MNRRGFLLGLGAAAVAAPAIVRVASLMPVRAWLTKEQIINNALLPPYGLSPGMLALADWAKLEEYRIQRILYEDVFRILTQENEIMKDIPYVSSPRIPYRTGLHLGSRARDRAGRFLNAGEADRLGSAAYRVHK